MDPRPTASTPVASSTLAMLLSDARLPAGGHVNSNGLEAALRSGLSPHCVPAYVRTRATTVVLVEAGTAVVARATAVISGDGLDAVQAEYEARTPSAALRAIAGTLGAGLVRVAREVWPNEPLISGLPASGLARPVVLGALAAAIGLEAADLARLIAYDDAQTIAAAALKLEPTAPARATRWVLEACAVFEPHVAALASLTDPATIPVTGTPQIEEWAEAHTRLDRRLFRA